MDCWAKRGEWTKREKPIRKRKGKQEVERERDDDKGRKKVVLQKRPEGELPARK